MTLMLHSELTNQLLALKAEVSNRLDEIVKRTSGGVNREGGYLNARIVGGENDGAGTLTNAESLKKEQAPSAPASQTVSGFMFGRTSEKELIGVKPELVNCVRRALQLSIQDFMVFDGIRSIEEQRQHVANGTSKTMKSKHLDGLAVDLVPWVDGKPVWDWKRIYRIAAAMDQAATELGIAGNIRWGGAWDRTLADFGGDSTKYRIECAAYATRHPGKDFLDGPHFEWVN